MDGESLDIKQEKIERLKELLPEVFTEEKIDWEKLKATLGEDVEFKNERYVLNWAGKSDAFRVLQTPTTATLAPDRDESVNFDDTENVFIEGENLEVLKVLQKSYFGKIKMIYIDPPYNTGNDNFIYPDRFSETKEEYLGRIGDKDEAGYMTREGLFRKNSKDSGHYHSNWLSMMYPRLFLARNLLRDDGIIFVSIDDNEVHNLRLLMNEVFGEENFRNSIIIKRGAKSVQAQFDTWDKLGNGYETVLFYTKNSNYRFLQRERQLKEVKDSGWNNHWRGTNRPTMRYELFGKTPDTGQWRWSKERSYKAIENYKAMLRELGETENTIQQADIDKWYKGKVTDMETDIDLLRLSKNGKPEHYIAPTETQLLNDVWFDFPPNSSSVLKKLFEKKIFDNPKPLSLIQRVLDFGSDDIILDFFSGSATTAHAVLDLNKQDNGARKFICVQLPEKCDEKSEAFKAGYKTIADIGKERIRRVIKKIKEDDKSKLPFEKSKQDLGFKVFKLQPSNFKIWQGDGIENGRQLEKHLQLHLDSIKKDASEEYMLYELLLKSGRDLNSKIENTDNYYRINDGEMVIAISKIDEKIVDSILEDKPQIFITLDKLFENNDQLKTNTALQMKDAGIEFKVV
ncbi:MAG: site-specific DNA-methyltransferase [Desulfobacteraceae bacterium]|nr:site-specific DNA-methyltransferase [Pseudomonadota bacterium]MCG2829631.1 site-specific DNA-methyltransferase [Desulfobacteraceae bacterium]